MEAINVDIEHFRAELLDNVENNILNYWIGKMVDPRGGFYGRRDGYDRLDADAPKGAILNGRILWSFAAAYRVTRKPEYLEMAQRAKRYIIDNFYETPEGKIIRYEKLSKYSTLNKEELIAIQMTGKMPWGGCRKIIVRDIIESNNIEYSNDPVGEEALFSFKVF